MTSMQSLCEMGAKSVWFGTRAYLGRFNCVSALHLWWSTLNRPREYTQLCFLTWNHFKWAPSFTAPSSCPSLVSSCSPNLQKWFNVSSLLKMPAHPLSSLLLTWLETSLRMHVWSDEDSCISLHQVNPPTSTGTCPFCAFLGQTILFWLPSNCASSIPFAFFHWS